ncbi:hypothetical protein L1887_35554 [Cichorium endivia]|nr:hypothetical protein L1887_35554 [Cichorium endivia]
MASLEASSAIKKILISPSLEAKSTADFLLEQHYDVYCALEVRSVKFWAKFRHYEHELVETKHEIYS